MKTKRKAGGATQARTGRKGARKGQGSEVGRTPEAAGKDLAAPIRSLEELERFTLESYTRVPLGRDRGRAMHEALRSDRLFNVLWWALWSLDPTALGMGRVLHGMTAAEVKEWTRGRRALLDVPENDLAEFCLQWLRATIKRMEADRSALARDFRAWWLEGLAGYVDPGVLESCGVLIPVDGRVNGTLGKDGATAFRDVRERWQKGLASDVRSGNPPHRPSRSRGRFLLGLATMLAEDPRVDATLQKNARRKVAEWAHAKLAAKGEGKVPTVVNLVAEMRRAEVKAAKVKLEAERRARERQSCRSTPGV